MGVDQALEKFRELRGRLPPDDDRPITDNESCARLHLIDPILEHVLDWPREKTIAEAPGGEALDAGDNAREGRVDYVVRDAANVCWFVIEAKRRNYSLLDRGGGAARGLETLKLTGPVLVKGCWPIISKQMSPYLGRYMPCFGAVTTGEQWVGFLGRLRPEDTLLESCVAVVFRSLDDIEHDFEQFYELFGREGAQRRTLLRTLAPAASRGLVRGSNAQRVVLPGAERMLDYQRNREFYDDLRRAMDIAFRPIREDHQALEACFVESRESREAGSRLERIANEMGEALHDADVHYPPRVRDEVEAATSGPPPDNVESLGTGYLARLLGEKSAGKSVFLQRFFKLTLKNRRDRIAVVWIDVERTAPFDPVRASHDMLGQLIREIFGEEGPSWEQIREVYRREWNQHRRLLGVRDGEENENADVRKMFVRERLSAEQHDPHEAVRRYVEFATRNRKRLVCIVVDNLDHLERPQAVVEWAVARHRSCFAMMTVAMEDATAWRLRRSGGDQLADHQPEQFWLHRPKVREVVQNRCDYLRKTLAAAPGVATQRTTTSVGRGQWRWTVRPEDLVRTVSAVLLDDEHTSQWIGELCNFDLREVLEVCQQIVLSPHVRTDELLTAQVAQAGPSPYRVLKALIAPKSEQFQGLPTDRVTNILGHWLGQDVAPLLPGRLLALLAAREDEGRNRREPFAGFVAISELAELFERCTSVPRAVTITTLRHLSALKLVEPFNPADHGLEDSDVRVKITARGRLHLNWALGEVTYVRLMAEVDPIVRPLAFSELRTRWISFLDHIKEPGSKEREFAVASTYVECLLALAAEASPLVGEDEVESMRRFDRALLESWGRR